MQPDFSRSLHILLSWSLEQTGLASSTWCLFYWHILIVLHINTNYQKNIFLLVFYPSPLLPTSLQWPLIPLPQVAVVKSFECKNIFPVYLKWAWINRSIKNKSTKISGHKYLQSLQRTYFSASIACTKGMPSSTTFVLSLYLGLFLRRE